MTRKEVVFRSLEIRDSSAERLKEGTVPEAASTIELTAEVVASYIGNHQVAPSELPALIRSVYGAFAGEPDAASEAAVATLTKAQIRKSVTSDAIISFEDGRGYKMLRRHLAAHDLTPAAYRAKWGLPPDYPMVAPTYHEQRSAMAVARGLGRKVAVATPAPPKKAWTPRSPKAPAA